MSLGRHRGWNSRESPSVLMSVGQFGNWPDCIPLIYMYVGNPVLHLAFFPSGQLPSSASLWMVKGRLSWWITSGLCFTFWHPKHPHRHPLPFLLPPSSGLSRTISSSMTGTQFTNVDKLQWLVLSYNHNYIIIINPLTARIVWAPQMILQPVFSIFNLCNWYM